MTPEIWDPIRCNFEAPGAGLINAAGWFGSARPPSFPSDSEMLAKHSAALKGHPRIALLLSHKGGMGDTLMCSTVARELRRRGVGNIWLETRWPADFAGQSVFDGVLPESYESEWLVEKLGGRIVYPAYARAVPGEDREVAPSGTSSGRCAASPESSVRSRCGLILTRPARLPRSSRRISSRSAASAAMPS